MYSFYIFMCVCVSQSNWSKLCLSLSLTQATARCLH